MREVGALALGIAASPFPVIPAILLLFTARPRPTSLAFLGGWFGGIGSVVGVFVVLAELLDPGGDPPTWLSWVRIAAGIALVGYGLRRWVTRRASAEMPGWVRSIQDATPRTAARLALLLSAANPKVMLLAAAAGLEIGDADLTTAGAIVAAGAFTIVASMSVAIPVIAYAVKGDSVLPPLERAKVWLLRHNAMIMAIVLTVIGLVVLSNGVTAL